MLTQLFYSLMFTFGISIGFLVIKYGTWLTLRAWAWMDDSLPPYWNPFTVSIMKLWGYHLSDDFWAENSNRKHRVLRKGSERVRDYDEARCYTVFTWAIIVISGPSLYISVYFYPVTLFVITLTLLAFLTRFLRRLSKKFKSHVEDKDAHSKS